MSRSRRYVNRRVELDYMGRGTRRDREVKLAKTDTAAQLIASIECDHSQMKECHPGCGHFVCPCGVSWDEGAQC